MNAVTPSALYMMTAIALIIIGFAGAMIRRNLLKMVLGFALVDTGIHLLIATLGSRPDGMAPIIDSEKMLADKAGLVGDVGLIVDPVPQALVLTAIVIGVGVTALMLAYVVRLYALRGTLDVREYGRLKW